MDAIAVRRIALRTVIETSTLVEVAANAYRLLDQDGPCADCEARPAGVLPASFEDPACCRSERRQARRAVHHGIN